MSIRTIVVGNQKKVIGIASAEQVAEARRLIGNMFDFSEIARISREHDEAVLAQLETKLTKIDNCKE